MPPSKSNNAVLLLAVVSLCLALAACSSPPPRALAAAANKRGKPLVTAIAKDAATKLYAAPLIKGGRPLVLDLSGPTIISFTCDPNKRPTPTTLTTILLFANATDGRNPLYPVSFPAAASCAPPASSSSLGGRKLPAGAAGVAGLASSSAALPAQVARAQRFPDKFLLCLPRSGGDGVAIFGGGPLFLTTITGAAFVDDFTSGLTYTPLLSKGGSPSYYLPVRAIAVGGAQVKLPGGALALATGGGGVVLSTTAPYTALRPDVYRPFVRAFDAALTKQSNSKRVAAVAPFELCYDSSTLPGPTRIGWLVPDIDLVLEGGKNWTFVAGLNTMVDVNGFTAACFAFVEMKPKKDGGGGGYSGAPAVEIGGFQMENHVLQFDLEKKRLGFTKLQIFTSCSLFNFTLPH